MAAAVNPLARLKDGVRAFQRDVYAGKEAEYQYAATHPQKPHTLFITCSDSRIDAETITGSGPGQIFVNRNVGNIVPSYGEMMGGVSAVIEYAVDALGVESIVVCGHSDCGAMKGILAGEGALDSLPTVKNWLRNADAAKRVAATMDGDHAKLNTLTEQNVLLQMQHLKTHPAVAAGLAKGSLQVYGWVYEIGAGDVRIYDDGTGHFYSVRDEAADAQTAAPAQTA